MLWLIPIIMTCFFSASHMWCSPFIPALTQEVARKNFQKALWISVITGLLRDIILSTPRFGLCAFARLGAITIGIFLTKHLPLERLIAKIALVSVITIFDLIFTLTLASFFSATHVSWYLGLRILTALGLNNLLAFLPLIIRTTIKTIRLYRVRRSYDANS